MSVSIIPVSVTANSPASGGASPFGAGAMGAGGNIFSGLLSLLQSDGNGLSQQGGLPTGETGSAKVIMLPADRNNLNALLSGLNLSGQGGENSGTGTSDISALTDKILQALTTGTPLVGIPTSETGDAGQISLMSMDELKNLVSSNEESLSGAKILLVAAPDATPATLDKLAKKISAALAQTNELNALPANGNAEGKEDPLTLVLLLSPDSGNATEDSLSQLATDGNKDETSTDNALLLYSGLITPQYQTTGAEQKKAGSSFEPSSGIGTDKPFEISAETSLDELDTGYKSISASGKLKDTDITGKLDTSSASDNSASMRFMSDLSSTGQNMTIDTAGLRGAHQGTALTNPLLNNPSAAGAHPATRTVESQLSTLFQNGEVKNQQLSIQLDPPELGRIQVHLSLEKGDSMKVHILADNEDTLALLKKDSHNLRETLEMAGIKTDDTSLSFDMSNNSNNFQQALAQQQGEQYQSRSSNFRIEVPEDGSSGAIGGIKDSGLIETGLGIRTDPDTGTVRYNILA